jgi:hypothetical protein
MKKFLVLVPLLFCASAFGQTTNLTFVWDPSVGATGYRFYELFGPNRTLLGTSGTNGIVIPNWNTSQPHTVTVTATNALGESAQAVPLSVPAAPSPVQNLRLVPLTINSAVPGTIEISRDLIDWNQRIRLASAGPGLVAVTWVQYPTEPLLFMRSKAGVTFTAPPLPK